MRISDWSSDVCSSDLSPLGVLIVLPAGIASPSRLRTVGLVNSPRTITSQLPRREEKTLRSAGSAPCAISQRAASPSGGIAPAGDIWSVVMRSEEHTSELQSLMRISYAVFCLKKKRTDVKIE